MSGQISMNRGIKGEPIQAIIRLDPPASRWVREQEWDGLTKTVELEDDIIELHFDTNGRQGLFRQILEWGGCAEVIEPPDFRQQVLDESHIYNRKLGPQLRM